MLRIKYIKITAGISVILLATGFTISRLESNHSIKDQISGNLFDASTNVTSGTEDNELDENTSRVYFSIFRFISNLVPAGSSN
ncbi:MAG: hypothetical protein H0W61_07625 [Bacteroidetes bacterium]|nr:hypothetical protein [Bacteroidota bacterium]